MGDGMKRVGMGLSLPGFGGLKSCLSSWKSAQADSLIKPEGLPCTEQVASAPLVCVRSRIGDGMKRVGMSYLFFCNIAIGS